MKWKQAETKQKNTLPQTIPETSYSEKIERNIEKLVDKMLEPHEQRLRAIENQAEYHVRQPQLRGFNGKRRIRVDIGTNQERITNG